MTSDLWNLYLQLQTAIAYGDAQPAPLQLAVLEASVEFFHAIVARRHVRRALVIGPWSRTELAAWQRVVPSLDVLTAFPREARLLETLTPIQVGDIHQMPYSTGAFDLLYASNVLEHVFAPYIALMECRRVLREGGVALLTFPSFAGPEGGQGPFHLHCLDIPVWKELLRKTGLQACAEWRVPGEYSGSVAVQELLATRTEGSFEERTGCAQYWTVLCEADTPPPPHDRILASVIAYVAS